MAISRALCEINEEHRSPLKKEGFLTRDPRMVERKKPDEKSKKKIPVLQTLIRRFYSIIYFKIHLIYIMANIEYKDLLDAGVHFGHLTRKWDPRMAPYIFMEKNGIHIIDLNKTLVCLEEASNAIKQIVRSGKKVMFVATKKQAKDLVAEEARRLNMPYVTERWLGGMMTNFATIRKSLKKMSTIDKMIQGRRL
jgi:hypothetical protein